MTRQEQAKIRLKGYINELDELFKEKQKEYPPIVKKAITNQIDQTTRHWETVLDSEK